MPNLIGQSASPLLQDIIVPVEVSDRGAARDHVRLADQAIDRFPDHVVLDHLTVGRGVPVLDAVVVPRPDGIEIAAEVARQPFDHGLDREHALGAAEAAKRGVGDGIGLAGIAAKHHVRQVIAVVGVAEGPVQDGGREIRHMAGAGRERHIEAEDPAVVVEADVIVDREVVALAGDNHVVVTRQAKLDRPIRGPSQQSGDRGDDRCLTFLAAERPAEPAHFRGDLGERQAEHVGNAVLDLGRVLARGVHQHVAILAGHRERDLAFQVEMVLGAARDRALQAMRRGGQRRRRVAAAHHLRRSDELPARQRLGNRQHRRQLNVVDRDQRRRPARDIPVARRRPPPPGGRHTRPNPRPAPARRPGSARCRWCPECRPR